MKDAYGRDITYLRISITDRCNFRCSYCMPEEGVVEKQHREILRYEEILDVARAAVDLGVTSIRITGGEPLVRRGVVGLVRSLATLKRHGLKDLSMTTNGALLKDFARQLKEAGLDRVNISLDTLDPGRFASITRLGVLDGTLSGVGAALCAGLLPVKINVVVQRTKNASEALDFAWLSWLLPVEVRFIELMPLGSAAMLNDEFVSAVEVKEALAIRGQLLPASLSTLGPGTGPARYYEWHPSEATPTAAAMRAAATVMGVAGAGARLSACSVNEAARGERGGTVGFITAVSEHFCAACNRLRMTSDGKLNPCLWSDIQFDAREILRERAAPEQLKALLLAAVAAKPLAHGQASPETKKRRMSRLGG